MMTRTRTLAALAFGTLVVAAPAPAQAQQFVANQIAGLVSSENAQVEITGLSGALSGALRIEEVTVSDADGVYLRATDLALDWSPFALVRSNVEVENLSAGRIELTRLPGTAPADPDAETAGGGFSLPAIDARIGRIAIGEFVLGEEVTGVAATLTAQASLQLASETTQLDASATVRRLDQPGDIALALSFAPNDDRLDIDVSASEPAGGIVAGLLDLPGAPPVALEIRGEGPLDAFSANGSLDIDGARAVTLAATVADQAAGRRVTAEISTITGPFVPEEYVDVVGDTADLDVAVTLREDGVVLIENGQLASGNLRVGAAGTYDGNGAGNDLRVTVATDSGNPVPLGFGSGTARTELEIGGIEATLRGALSAAAVEANASLRTARFGDYAVQELNASLSTTDFNLGAPAGGFRLSANARSASAPDGVQARFLEGPITVTAAGTLGDNTLQLDESRLATAVANLAASGTAALDFTTFSLAATTDFETAALSDAAIPYTGPRIGANGSFRRAEDGSLSADDLSVSGEGLAITGNARLAGDAVEASVRGSLDQSANPETQLEGRADFTLEARGTTNAPAIDLALTASGLMVGGRPLDDLDARIQGTFSPASPEGTVAVTGRYNNQPLAVSADFSTAEDGARSFRDLLVEQGGNRLEGEIVVSADNVPAGTLTLQAPDVSTLAAIAGQDASGDAAGTLQFSRESDGTPTVEVALRSASLAAGETTLVGADIDVRALDYLIRPVASGTVNATSFRSGTLQVDDLAVDLAGLNDATVLDAAVTVNSVPIELVGDVEVVETGIRLALRTLEAAIEGAAVSLREPATIVTGGGITNLGAIVLSVGEGSLSASGTVGTGVDLEVQLDAFPLAVANPFVEGLDAAGFLTGELQTAGSAGNPRADFQLSGSAIATAQTRAAGIETVELFARGRYRNAVATLEDATVDLGTGSIRVTGDIGEALDLAVALNALPVSLANGFVDGLDAQGSISGTAAITGRQTNPAARFEITGEDITAARVAAAGVDPLQLDVAGTLRNGTVRLDRATADLGEGEISATGSVGRDLDLQLVAEALPLALANGFREGLDARGTLSGTAQATGSIANPQARFALAGSGLSVASLRQSGIETVTLSLEGAFAERTLTLSQAELDTGTGRLEASGTVGEALDLAVRLDNLPAALANAWQSDFGAEGVLSGALDATGSLDEPAATFDLQADGVSLARTRAASVPALDAVARGSYANGTATIDTASLDVGAGSLALQGTVGELLDLDIQVQELPLALADGFVDELGAAGTLSGTASATGPVAQPDATFDVIATGVSVAQARALGAPPLDAVVAGTFADGTATLSSARIDLQGGGSVIATGRVGQELAVNATLDAIPLSLAAAVVPDLAPFGSLSGTVAATGSLAAPDVTYDLAVASLSLAPIANAGVGALDVSASGAYSGNAVRIDGLDLSGSGIALNAAGSIGIAGTPSFDLRVDGTAPLSLANRFLAEGGRSANGTVAISVAVSGTAAAPNASGTISTTGAQFVDTGTNIAVNGITTTIALSGDTATIQSFTASLSTGGTLAASGTIGLTGGFPADLAITANGARYTDGELLSTTVDASLTLTGDLTATPVLGGTVNAREINVTVPDNLPPSFQRLGVRHVNAPPAVLQQQSEIDPDRGEGGTEGGGIALDIVLNAPNQVFVRGRGIDMELGGSIQATGPISSLAVVGGFELQRGRFQILSRRLDFERASLSFTGNLVPTLDILAASEAGDVTVRIAITGPANDPSFSFSSAPALPQDEVLARLIFGQATTDLSPLQIAQLANAAAQLTGVGGSSGLLDNLRSQLGVDDIDIRTTADGQAAVGVGRYINDNTYVGVDSTGRVAIDLELGADIRARGAVTAEGGGEVGLFYEREY